jgi:hypothetical protein
MSIRSILGAAIAVGLCGGVGQLAAQDRITLICQPTQFTEVPRFVLDVDFVNRTVFRRPNSELYPATFTATSIRFTETYRGKRLLVWEIDRTTGDMYSPNIADSVQANCRPAGGPTF